MKTIAILAILLVAAGIFYVTGGAELTGLVQPAELPETIALPNATFMGTEQSNPFAKS